jgi:Domain of unknown function (DUF4145)
MADRTKAELIGQVIQRLAAGRFAIKKDRDREEITVFSYGPTFAEKEAFFRSYLSQLHDMTYEMEPDDPNASWESPFLEENWSDFWTEQLIALWLGGDVPPSIAEHFKGQSYEQVVSLLYDALDTGMKERSSSFVNARERLASIEEALREAETMDQEDGETLDLVAENYALQIWSRFTRIVRRADQLRVLGIADRPLTDVQSYLQEATRCYIWGFYVASLVLCRSAIEFAIRDRLKAHGKLEKLLQLERSRQDTLDKLIELAKAELPWNLKESLRVADIVREEANRAVHRKAPDSERCKEMFVVTRGALKELYTVPNSI